MSKATINYKDLKKAIVKCANKSGGKRENAFSIDFAKLTNAVAPMGLIPVEVGVYGPEISRRITPSDIAPLNEYFIEQKLSWFDKAKWIGYLTFADVDNDKREEITELLDDLKVKPEDDPDIDHTELLALLTANYPCYHACIVSYKSNNPNFMDNNSYIVVCRANKVIIKDPNYVYNSKDDVPVVQDGRTPVDENGNPANPEPED